MQRWLSVLLGLAVVVLAVGLAAQAMKGWHPSAAAQDAGADGGLVLALEAGDLPPPDVTDADLLDLPVFTTPERRMDGGVGYHMLDGTPVPPLPDSAPRRVRFGVVLITYVGAEDAPSHGRSKQAALELAKQLAGTAKKEFHAAVRLGDDGSTDDVGRVYRGILEPAPEYVLFTLPVGAVSGPIDTPRGYWIVKRLE